MFSRNQGQSAPELQNVYFGTLHTKYMISTHGMHVKLLRKQEFLLIIDIYIRK